MFNLIKNEVYKMFKTKKILVFMLVIFVYNFLPSLEQVMGTIDQAEIVINGQTTPFYMLNFMISNIFPIFIIVSLADMITGEYVNGTLKLALLHPVSRVKLLTAKMIALTLVLFCILIFSLVISYAMGTLIFGWGDQFSYQEPDQLIKNATVYPTIEGIYVTSSSYILSIFPLMAFGMIIMFMALLFNSSGVIAGISIGLVIFLSILGGAVEPIQPYLIVDGFSMFKEIFVLKDMTAFLNAILVTAVYGIGFFLASVYLFKKKDLTY